MNRLLLIGASGLALEAINIVRALDPRTELRILDDDPARWGSDVGGVPVVGDVDKVLDYPDHQVIVCVGHGSLRRRIVDRASRRGLVQGRFATLLHPAIRLPDGCTVGGGSILMEGVVLTAGVTVGHHVLMMPHVTLTHGNTVHDHATLCAGVALGGDVSVGAGAYVGMNACVRERLHVGRDATLGMGSVLLEDLPDGETWVGAPARRMTVPIVSAWMGATS